MSDLTTKAAEIRAGLVAELLRLADCDSRAGEPLGKCMRKAAALIEQQAAELDRERRSHQNTRDSRGRWKVSTFKEQRRATTAESEHDKALAELDRLRKLCTHDDDDICQTLGKALCYPWYKDDQSNFPGATEENGVCVGEHVAASIAAEAAKRLDALAAERDELLREKERLGAALEPFARADRALGRTPGSDRTFRLETDTGYREIHRDAFRRARSALENGPAGLADAHSKSPDPSSQSERIAVLAEREACAQSISSFIQAPGNFGKSDDYLQGFAAGANYTAERNAAAIRARAALAPLGEE